VSVHRETPMYRTWEELNQGATDAEGAIEYGAHDVVNAARLHASRWDRGEDLTWPRDFVVIDPASGKRFRVSVDRIIAYDYRPATPQEIP